MAAGAILLSGPVGSGKTTLLLELGNLLDERNDHYALVDLDWLAWLRPRGTTVQDVLVENLRSVWSNFRAAGVERLVLARFVERPEQVEGLRRALPGLELFVVGLEAPLAVLEARLQARDSGSDLEEHLGFLSNLVAVEADLVVENDGTRAPREVAREILVAAGWG